VNGTPEERAELERWMRGRPESVCELARKYPPWTCYRSSEHPHLHYVILSYGEDGTLRLAHGVDSTSPGHNTFGQDPSQLRACGCGKWQFGGDLLRTRDELERQYGVIPKEQVS
jgi:hypothetical protein